MRAICVILLCMTSCVSYGNDRCVHGDHWEIVEIYRDGKLVRYATKVGCKY